MPLTTCPPDRRIKDFVLGRMADRPAAALLAHVETCPRCQKALHEFGAGVSDDLVAALRGDPPPTVAFEKEAALATALSKLKSRAAVADSGAAELVPPKVLRDYQLLEKLGEGGMGAVYKALHTKLEKIVAIKLLAADRMRDASAIDRFHREMRAVGRLEHPNIVRASDAGEVDGRHFLVMQYVPGIDLSALVRQTGPLPIAEACALVRQAAEGLQFAHENGLVHRDIKPSNLMVTTTGQVKVLDLGLALLHDHPAGSKKGVEKGGRSKLPEWPGGCYAQIRPVPFFDRPLFRRPRPSRLTASSPPPASSWARSITWRPSSATTAAKSTSAQTFTVSARRFTSCWPAGRRSTSLAAIRR